jgi:multiple sugar transport system substrate-binding protein
MGQSRKTFRVAVRKFGPFESAIRKQWDAFAASEGAGLTLELEPLDLHPLYQTLFEEEGLRRGTWDIGFVNSDWFATCHESRALLDLAPLIASNPPEDFPKGWAPNLLELQRFGDEVLGLPYHDGPECMIYRKDLFESSGEQAAYRGRFGVPLTVPRSWQELRQVARFFTRPEQGLWGTVFAAFPDGHNTVYDFCLQLWTRGGELFSPEGNLTLNTPAAIQALEYYRELINDGLSVHPRSRELDSVQSGMAFARGEVAMMINWFGFAAMAETIAESRVKGRVEVTTLPERPVSLSVYWILGVGSGSPHAELAYRFLRHCISRRMDKLLTLEGGIGCRISTWEDPEVNRTIPFYRRMSELHSAARELPRRSDWPRLAGIIDRLVLEVMDTAEPVPSLVARYQRMAVG